MSTETLSPAERGILYVDLPQEQTLGSLKLLGSDTSEQLLKTLVRYTIMDFVRLKHLYRRVLDKYPRTAGITLITQTAYDAILLAREIILFRHSRNIKVDKAILPYRVGVHCSRTIEHDGFNLNHDDIEIARECADQAEAFEVYCSSHCMNVARQDCQAERKILNEFKPIFPSFWMWKFEQGYLPHKTSEGEIYFLSYAHEDMAVADHLEVLLRRDGRLVLRDETFMESGCLVNSKIENQIRCSDTFISIYSENYAKSDFCLGELARARRNMKEFGKPWRIALGRMSDIGVPLDLDHYLHHKISSNRDEIKNFVSSLIAQER